jgi:hypothetical protein
VLSQEDQTSLIWLQWHWEKHYVIRVMPGEWQAYAANAPLCQADLRRLTPS